MNWGVAALPDIYAVNQILRVNHAGERGAICIYSAQIFVSRLLYPECVAPLSEMLGHEKRHHATFESLLHARSTRPCYALPLWSLGGLLPGALTALAGQKAIWVCTAAIERTVNEHLDQQVEFLASRDPEALAAVQSIRRDEEAHEEHAVHYGGESSGIYAALRWVIRGATSIAIWLSTKL